MTDFAADAALARRGDTAAFARLYALIYRDLYRIARCSLRNSEDACDVVSDTVLDAFCSIGTLRDEAAFRHWMLRILSAKIRRRQREYYRAASVLEETQTGADFDYLSLDVREALARLDNESRLLLSLSVLSGYSSEEIADICDMKAGTVRSKLCRIKKQLRMQLDEDE